MSQETHSNNILAKHCLPRLVKGPTVGSLRLVNENVAFPPAVNNKPPVKNIVCEFPTSRSPLSVLNGNVTNAAKNLSTVSQLPPQIKRHPLSEVNGTTITYLGKKVASNTSPSKIPLPAHSSKPSILSQATARKIIIVRTPAHHQKSAPSQTLNSFVKGCPNQLPVLHKNVIAVKKIVPRILTPQPDNTVPKLLHSVPKRQITNLNKGPLNQSVELDNNHIAVKVSHSSHLNVPHCNASFPKPASVTNCHLNLQSNDVEQTCYEEEVAVEENVVNHSDSVFVIRAKPHHPQQKDSDLQKTRETFKEAITLCGKSISINNDSQEKELELLDSESCSIVSTNSKEGISKNKSKPKNDTLKDSIDSDGSLSDDFVKERHSSSKVRSKVLKKKRSPTNDDSPSNHETVLAILPENYDYKIISAEVSSKEFDQITALIRVNINAEEADKWKSDFESSSKTDFRVKKTWGEFSSDRRTLFKKKYRCHHNTLAEKSKSKNPSKKHIQCPATMVISVKNKNMKRSADDLLQSHPGVVLLNGTHNHSVRGGDILRFRRPAPEVKEKFTQMFTQYPPHTPATARDAYLADLEMDSEFALLDGVKDGAQVPSMSWLYRLYNQIYKEKCGDPTGEGMITALEKYVKLYNEECGETCAKMGTTEDGLHHFVVICTPLMKRVHTHLKASAETMFMDSTGCMDGANSRVFLILTSSVVGGLPLGMLITFSEREDVVDAALKLWKTILPDKAFFRRGIKGPKIIMTDDCTAERNSLRSHFPLAFLLLCVFHVLNAMWRYIWDSSHGVKGDDRQKIYFAFHEVLYAKSVDEFEELFDNLLESETVTAYDSVVKHLKDLRPRAKEWAVCHRSEMLDRGHRTNNLSEAAMKVMKDKVLQRTKAFNTVQLVDYMNTRLERFYKRKIAFVINNRTEGAQRTRYSIPEGKLKPLVAEKISTNLYQVKNLEKNSEYLVDTDLEVCACPVGSCGAPCKHQAAVAKAFGLSNHQLLPYNDAASKTVLFYIMMGHTNIPPGFFDTLKGGICEPVDLSTIPEFNDDSEDVAQSDSIATMQPDLALSENSVVETSDSVVSQPGDEATNTESSEIKLKPFFEDLVMRCDDNPVFREPLEKFLKSYWSIVKRRNHDSTLCSALATFGKGQASQTPIRRGEILNQPTTDKRRLVHEGGRSAQKGGRPRKVKNDSAEHGYIKAKKRKAAALISWACLPKKAKVPHSLSKCVAANCRLPK